MLKLGPSAVLGSTARRPLTSRFWKLSLPLSAPFVAFTY